MVLINTIAMQIEGKQKGAVMERLTDKNDVGSCFYPKCFERCDGLGASSKCDNCEIMTSIFEKLGKYEDLEEQGRLIKLPCKVGDRLYRIDFLGFIISDTVHSIHILRNTAYLEMNYWDKDIFLSEVGKTVFLTKSEAEAKLKELRGEE